MIRSRYARSTTAAAFSATETVRVASKARISICSFGNSPSSRDPSSLAPSPRVAVHSSSVPKSWTKPKSTSPMVGPEATAIERAKKPMPRFAFSEPSIGSITTCVAQSPRTPTSSETIVKSPSPSNRARITRSAAASIAVVSSPPTPSPTTGSRSDRRGSSASTPRTSSTAARQSASQSVKRVEQQAGRELGIEVRALLRHRLAASRDRPDVLDPSGAKQKRCFGFAAVDRCNGVGALRGVGHALRCDLLDDLHIETVAAKQLVLPVAIHDDARQLVPRLVDRSTSRAVHVCGHSMGWEDRQPFLVRRHEHNHQVGRAALLRVRDRGLVAVVAVRNQELSALEARRIHDAPQLVAAALEIGSAVRGLERVALVEEEDRLELRAGGAEQPKPALLGATMRSLVREHGARLVRLRSERGDEAGPRPGNTVRADIVLGEEPVAGLRLPREHALLAPGDHVTACLLLVVRERQMDDVVRTAREVRLPLLGRDHVVRRRHEPLQRARLRFVVALGAERLDHGHL